MPSSEIERIKQKAISYPRSLLDWEIGILDDLERRKRARGRNKKTEQPEPAEAD